jgi:hypothetical protein
MKTPYNKQVVFKPVTYIAAAANKAVTITLTPESGGYVILDELVLDWDDAPTFPVLCTISIGGTARWVENVRAEPHRISFQQGLYETTPDATMTILVAADAARKQRINMIVDQSTTPVKTEA